MPHHSADDIKGIGVAGVRGAPGGLAGAGFGGVGGRAGGDGLSLDLQFAADKTLTARKGPTPVFTRASGATYVGSNGLIQSAGNNVARFDHDPVTLASRGLLIEESRTNQALYSGALVNNAGWSLAQATSVLSGTGPDGNPAYEIAEDIMVSQVHGILNSGGITGTAATSVVSGTVYSGSIFLKKISGSVDWVQVTLGSAGFGSAQFANFNLSTGAIGNTSGLASPARIEAFPNGWYRCSVAVAAIATITTSFGTAIYLTNNTNSTTRAPLYNGNTANKFLASMCQFEVGSFATSYIPTTTASVVRSADVCSISGAAFNQFYNQTQGTAVVKTIGGDAASSRNLFEFTSSPPSDILYVSAYSRFLATEVAIVTNNIQQFVYFGSLTRGNERLSIAYAQNNSAYCRNGAIAAADTSVITSSLINQLSLGANGINGCISSFSYYRKRLPNAKLQALTV